MLASWQVQSHCWKEAELKYRIDAKLLKSIAIVESGMNPYAFNKNRDGSFDLGLMQINNKNFGLLREKGIEPMDLVNNPCQSVMAGALILTIMIRKFGYNWQAVGAYNAGLKEGLENDRRRMKYAAKVWGIYKQPNI
jgi:Soluble lytic murein transglycosylase and related regulatory proteins (some contain LysM/invasin domains)